MNKGSWTEICYRFPFGMPKALERERRAAGRVGDENLLEKIISGSPVQWRDEEFTKLVNGFIQGLTGFLNAGELRIGPEALKLKVGEEEVGIGIEFGRTDVLSRISGENLQPGGAVDKMVEKVDDSFREIDRPVYKYITDGGETNAFSNKGREWTSEMQGFLGVDVGAVSTNVVFLDEHENVLETVYTYTRGQVLNALKKAMGEIREKLPDNVNILGVGVTGSSGELAKSILSADTYKTEIYSHAVATLQQIPEVRTIMEIGGQDSKVIYIENGVPEKSKMNEWCGAGTGAMLDAQAHRLGIPIQDFGGYALRAKKAIDFRTRCGVFIESCTIDAQASGYPLEDIIAGLCKACARNYFSTLGIDRKKIATPIAFQGGVAANQGVKEALEDYTAEGKGEKCELIVPLFHDVMGATGMALIMQKTYESKTEPTNFRGFDEVNMISSEVEECEYGTSCPRDKTPESLCDLVKLRIGDKTIATVGACEEYPELAQG